MTRNREKKNEIQESRYVFSILKVWILLDFHIKFVSIFRIRFQARTSPCTKRLLDPPRDPDCRSVWAMTAGLLALGWGWQTSSPRGMLPRPDLGLESRGGHLVRWPPGRSFASSPRLSPPGARFPGLGQGCSRGTALSAAAWATMAAGRQQVKSLTRSQAWRPLHTQVWWPPSQACTLPACWHASFGCGSEALPVTFRTSWQPCTPCARSRTYSETRLHSCISINLYFPNENLRKAVTVVII